ncbi:uncharacterized protein EDB91DRAFT_1244960 [Suillus paluster]|uniref:uncharacterized protein n=1 Tax=Suillus paluster TaxID=48578 RepID=UPI001B870905|nr:uncharacterized protein EDB91DRAFT_1244960 [Suillus paluster]KAG1748246.1 hypothetical protein EDB91DRAFT_1244960 [Suillus paluster]
MTPAFSALKRWFLRVARRSASFFSFFLSLLRRFSRYRSKPGDSRLISQPRISNGALPRPLEGDIAGEDVPVCFSLLPPDPMGVEAAGESLSPSDDPYTGTHSRPLLKGTLAPLLEGNEAAAGRPGATETDGLHQGSMSSLHSPPQGEASVDNRTILNDPLQESSSPGSSRFSGLHEVSRTHSRPQGYMDDAHSINTTHTPSMSHMAPGMPYSQYASDSRVSTSIGRSLTRSIAGSESRQAAYRTHTGPVHSRPVSVHSSIHHGSLNTVSVPLDSPAQVVPGSDLGIDHHVHYTAPPDSDEQPGTEAVMVYDGPPISAMVPSGVRRAANNSKTTVPAMTITFPLHDLDVPPGWISVVHPEGARYFVNQTTVRQVHGFLKADGLRYDAQRTITEMNIYDEEICADIEYFMAYLLGELRWTVEHGNLTLDMTQVDLVVEPKVLDSTSVVCCYYFTNHRDRCLFWLDDFDAQDILFECKSIKTLAHIRLAIQTQYWFICMQAHTQRRSHWDYFPSQCPVAQDLVDEVENTLVHAACDSLTSTESPMAFGAIEVRELLSAVDKIKVHSSAYQNTQQCHAAIVIVHELRKIFVDDATCTVRWNAFSLKAKGQLQNSNLLATILLNVNVGFLAINSVDKGGRNAVQMASYMSLVVSMGSMILGLLLVSHNRTMGQDTSKQTFFNQDFTIETTSLKSWPSFTASQGVAHLGYGSMILFFTAFSIDWWSPGDRTSRILVGTMTLAVFATISNNILRILEGDFWPWQPILLHGGIDRRLLDSLADAWKRVMKFMGMGMRRAERALIRDSQLHTEGFDLNPFGSLQPDAEPDIPLRGTSHPILPLIPLEILGPDDRDTYPHSYPPIPPYQPTTAADSPQQPHDVSSVLPSSDSRTSPGFLSGAGPLQSSALAGTVRTAANAILHSDALPTIATDTATSTLPGPSRTEERERVEYTDNVVEEPGELDDPQRLSSTTPPPRIFTRSATADYGRHAPVAPRWALEDGHVIEECQEYEKWLVVIARGKPFVQCDDV